MSRWLVGSSSRRMSGSATSDLGQQDAPLHARGERLEPGVGVEPHPGDDRLDPVVGVRRPRGPASASPSATSSATVPPRPSGTSWGSRAIRSPCWRMTSPSSGSSSPSDQPEQRALALAVAAQQADPLAPLDLQSTRSSSRGPPKARLTSRRLNNAMNALDLVATDRRMSDDRPGRPRRGGHRGRATSSLTNSGGSVARRPGRPGHARRRSAAPIPARPAPMLIFVFCRAESCLRPAEVVNCTRRARDRGRGRGPRAGSRGRPSPSRMVFHETGRRRRRPHSFLRTIEGESHVRDQSPAATGQGGPAEEARLARAQRHRPGRPHRRGRRRRVPVHGDGRLQLGRQRPERPDGRRGQGPHDAAGGRGLIGKAPDDAGSDCPGSAPRLTRRRPTPGRR